MNKYFDFRAKNYAEKENICNQILMRVETQNSNNNLWDLLDKTLYDLCQKYPYHNNRQEIMTKICLIGRAYSAQIERRKNAEYTKGDFYSDYVVPTLMNSEIDDRIAQLKQYKYPNAENIEEILSVHKYLQDLFESITDMSKRSLASKYLHFHCPNLFYIYDSVSETEINRIIKRKENIPYTDADYRYAMYFGKSLYIQEIIAPDEMNFPRILDSFLQDKFYKG